MSADPPLDSQVDEATPRRLVRQGGAPFLEKMARTYLESWEGRVEGLVEAIERDDRAEAVRLAHGLGSSSNLVGVIGLGRILAGIERDAEAGSCRGAQAAARVRHELRLAFEQVRPWIERHTGR